MDNERFTEVTGLRAPTNEQGLVSLGEAILRQIKLLPPERRREFVDELPPEQRRLLNIIEMPGDLSDTEALQEWLDA